jgi:uncharacterized membrane protein YwzB
MKSALVINALRIAACVGGFVAIFQVPLGLPGRVETAGAVVLLVCALGAWRLQLIRRRSICEKVSTSARQLRMARCLIAIVTTVALSSSFWLPYTGSTLRPTQLWISAIATWVALIVVTVPAPGFPSVKTEPQSGSEQIELGLFSS